MPAKYMHSFTPRVVSGNAAYVFAWSNDPAEDADFLNYLSAALPWGGYEVRNAAVDRSGAQPSAAWELWRISDNTFIESGALALSTGSAVYQAYRSDLTEFGTVGYWDSDVEGRPFDLNDLLA